MLSSPDNIFEKTLRQNVKDYFAYNQLTPKGGHAVACKIVVVLLGLLLAYIGMIFLGSKTPILLIDFLLALLFFQVTAALGVMHDASHNALTNNRHLNLFISYLIMATGGMSARIWKQKHVFAHHSHPNTSNKDTDIEGQPLFRFSPFQKRYWFHRKQHYYALFFYTLLTIKWVLFDDVRDVIMNVYQLNLKKRLLCSIDIILTRIIYLTLSLLVPFIVFHSFWIILGIWLFYNMSFSLCLTLVFQCSHVNTKTCFYPDKVEAPNSFAIRQLDTTVDYGINNSFLTWIVGGLNFQVIADPPFISNGQSSIFPSNPKVIGEMFRAASRNCLSPFPKFSCCHQRPSAFLKAGCASIAYMRVTMNKGKISHCAYCEEQTTDIAVSGQRCISKKSSELYPYFICHACYSVLNPPQYLQNAERIRGKQLFWEKVDKNLRKKKRAETN